MTGMLGEATIRELDIGMTGSLVGPGDRDYETADRDSPLLLNCAARTPDLADPSHVDWARSARNAVANYGKGGTYVNFSGEGGSDNLRASYPSHIYGKLQAVKDQYDPFNLFRFNINIRPTKCER